MSEVELKSDKRVKSKKTSLSTIVPYLGSFIIFLGILRLMLFYRSFGISIVSYLDFSEIITSFLDIIVFAVPLLVVGTIQTTLQQREYETERNNVLEERVINEERFLKRLLLYFGLSLELLIAGVITTISVFFTSANRNFLDALWTFYLYIIGFFLLIVVPRELEIKHIKFKHSDSFRAIMRLFLVATLLMLTIAIYSSKEVESIKEGKKNYGVRLLLDSGEEIVSDSTQYYIGKTQNYVFFFKEKES